MYTTLRIPDKLEEKIQEKRVGKTHTTRNSYILYLIREDVIE